MTSVSAVQFPKGSIRAYWKVSPTSSRVPQKQDALDLAKGQGGQYCGGERGAERGACCEMGMDLGWAGRCWQKREGKRYLNRGVTGTVELGERQGKNSTGKGLARVGRGGAGQ